MKKEKQAIFFIALPGAGKSTLIEERNYHSDYVVISADSFKESHPDYNPKRPDLLHEWSVNEAEFQATGVLSDEGYNIVFDGGGINNSYNIRIITKLKEKGYKIKIIHVNTPLIECLRRNELRERNVPKDSIISKSFEMEKAIKSQKPLADEFEVIEYFTNKHVFFDMDGVLCEYKSIPWLDHDFDYVNSEFFTNSKPVYPVISWAIDFNTQNKEVYILSASPNSITNTQKLSWLKRHMSFIKEENIYFVGNKEHKVTMLDSILKGKKIKPKDVMFIDDDHKTIDKMLKFGVNVYHPSKLLSQY